MAVRALGGEQTPLEGLGIDEVEPWIVADSYDNRRALRKAKMTWSVVTNEEGSPTGLVRVFDESQLTARRLEPWDRKEPILTDPSNPWSDYIVAYDYPADFDCPFWVKQNARQWVLDDRDGVPHEKRRPLPVRCEMVRVDGTRCWNWSARRDGINRCRDHLTWDAQVDVNNVHAARIKLSQLTPRAVDVLEELMDDAQSEPVRLKAADMVLDKNGIRGGVEVQVSGKVEMVDAREVIEQRLARLAERAEEAAKAAADAERAAVAASLSEPSDIVDAEVVERPAMEIEA